MTVAIVTVTDEVKIHCPTTGWTIRIIALVCRQGDDLSSSHASAAEWIDVATVANEMKTYVSRHKVKY